MITYSGVHIQKIGGVEGTPTAADIAVHAGRICRYGGAIWCPLLPHLIFVGLMAYRRSGSVYDLVGGFVHDAHEVVTCDVPRPFKCDCMRYEQKFLDEQIYPKFCGKNPINHNLIKECDKYALHIEAVELGLPNFSEIELAYADDYLGEKEIHRDPQDMAIFYRIKDSRFFNNITDGLSSLGVSDFANVLLWAERRQYFSVEQAVLNWGLLNTKKAHDSKTFEQLGEKI